MAAAIEPTWTTALFRPTNRLRDAVRELTGDDSYELPELTEVELIPDLSPGHVLATGITWEDFFRYLRDYKLVWMGPGVYVYPARYNYDGYRLLVELRSSNRYLRVYAAREPEPETEAVTTATCNFLVRLLATSTAKEAFTGSYGYESYSVPISGPALSHFCQESQDNLRKVTLDDVILNEEQIHALATASRSDIEVILSECNLWRDPDCHAAFVQCLHRDGGPIQLNKCEIDCHVLAAALEGNSRVTRLHLVPDRARATSDAEKGVIFRSLAENKGLVELYLNNRSISDETWTIMSQSLQGHPTLTSLDLRDTGPRAHNGFRMVLPNEQKPQRTRILAAMVEENQVLHSIHLDQDERDDQIYAESILPHLETNLYRPRVLGIKKVDIALRRALLGLALQKKSVRSKSNLIWMFLSGNQDVMLQSDEESAAVLQSDEESSEQEEEAATRKRKL
jgi:hypothetical protein